MKPFKGINLRLSAAMALLLLCGVLLCWWMVLRTDREMRADLLQQAHLLAQAVNIERIKALSGTGSDLKSAEYLRVKEQFNAVRTLYPLCRFAYLVGRNADGGLFFYLDSEPADSKDYSPPGQMYREAPHGLHRAFRTRNATVEGPYSDRWGTWVSALVPVHDPRTALYGLATPDDARALVGKAVDFYRRNGRERFLKEVSNPRSAFHRGDLYAFVYDRDMTMLAHPVKPEMIGQNQLNMKDWAGGTFFHKEIQDVARLTGSGWVDYEFENPASRAIASKATYVEAVDDLIICAGAYKGNGAVLALLGMDIDARAWNVKLARAALPPALLTLALLTLLVTGSALLDRRTLLELPPRWMRHLEPLLVAAVGLALTLFAAWAAHERGIYTRNESFVQLAKSRSETIATTLRELRSTGIESLARYYENIDRVTPEEFKRFSGFLAKNPSVLAWGWVPAVPAADRYRFEAATRTAGVKGFEIWQKDAHGQRSSATGREMYYPVEQVASLAGNGPALGYDIGSEPLRRAALEEAARTGLPTATEPINVLQQAGEQKDVLICRPVYSDGNRKRLRGFVIALLQMQTLLWSAPQDDSMLMGLSLLHRDARPELLAASWGTDSPPGSGLTASRPVFAFGKVFVVTSFAGPEFMRLHTMLAVWISVLIGLVLTTVITVMVGVILRGREELERLVLLRTSALRESKEHLSATLHSIGDGVIATDATGRVTDLNGVAERLTGWTTAEALGKPVVDVFTIVHAGTRVTAENPVEQTLREGEVVDLSNNIVLISRCGVEYQVADSCAPILDGEGHVLGAVLVFRDVTEEYCQREKLRASEEKHRTILQTTKAGFCLLDTRGNLLEVNEAFCRMSGFNAQELLDMRIFDLDCMEPETDLTNRIRKIMEQGAESFESRHRRKDGSVFEVDVSVQYLPAGEGWLVVFLQDISERKQSEREKTKLENQLHQAQKMESVGRLAGGVAHDFNNMLSVILGHAELALMKSDSFHPLSANLKQIRDAAIRSADLTRKLLAFARQQAITPKVLDLNETVAGMLNMLQRLIGENIDLSWHPKANLWPVKMDPSQVDQILANLCVNARDAISGVGSLVIETGNCVLDDNFCADHVGFAAGEYVRLTVSDNGCGMDPETLEHIFEPFFTTKELGKGTGLGLATVYGAVKQNSGYIDACSAPGQGTTFTIYLPRHAVGKEQAHQAAPAPPAAWGTETILLVEDEPSILEMAAAMLELQGYSVLAAGTPGEAILLADEHAGEIHLLMTDVVMPEMNGRELSDRLLPRYPDLACLYMSGYTADVIARHGVLNEGVYFIQKPFSMQSLAASVRDALERRR